MAGYAPEPGRLLLFLEGGYDFAALRSSVAATLGRLVGASPSGGDEVATSGGPGDEHVRMAAERRHRALDGS